MIDEKIISLLGLTRREVRVFSYLRENPSSQISSIASDTKIPRMTIYLTLESLKKRTLVDYSRKGKRRFWYSVEFSKLGSEIMGSVYSLTESKEIRVDIANSGFAIHQGIKGMYKVWQELNKLSPNSRVLGIQPTNTMKYALNTLNWQEKIAPLQENIIKKPIIIDGVLAEDYYKFLMAHYSNNKDLQKKVMESFLGRSTSITFIDSQYFKDAESELLILSDVAFLSDWKNLISIEIRNPAMLHFLKELYELAKGYGKKINQEEYIKKLIENIDK